MQRVFKRGLLFFEKGIKCALQLYNFEILNNFVEIQVSVKTESKQFDNPTIIIILCSKTNSNFSTTLFKLL